MTNGCDYKGCIEPAEYWDEWEDTKGKISYWCYNHRCVECKVIE
jgi:hypothetical protein